MTSPNCDTTGTLTAHGVCYDLEMSFGADELQLRLLQRGTVSAWGGSFDAHCACIPQIEPQHENWQRLPCRARS